MGDLGKDVASHVADVDLAHEPVEPVMPVAPPAFSRAISATPADEVVLSGGAVVAPVVHEEEETFEDAEGEVVDVFGEVDAPAVEDAPAPAPAPAVDAENVVPLSRRLRRAWRRCGRGSSRKSPLPRVQSDERSARSRMLTRSERIGIHSWDYSGNIK